VAFKKGDRVLPKGELPAVLPQVWARSGKVKRSARDGSWVDVEWPDGTSRRVAQEELVDLREQLESGKG